MHKQRSTVFPLGPFIRNTMQGFYVIISSSFANIFATASFIVFPNLRLVTTECHIPRPCVQQLHFLMLALLHEVILPLAFSL